MRQRLQKILSTYGIASRRAAEEMIAAGRVTVDGVTASLGDGADPDTETIAVDGVPMNDTAPRLVYIMLNKPRGVVTTMRDEKGRRTVAELVSDCPERVYPVGRLDIDSEGLLILTNDGALANALMHPAHGKKKTYHVRVIGDISTALPQLREPIEIDGYTTRPAEVTILRDAPDGGTLSMTIGEGRNRQVRRLCERSGLKVTSLRRVEEGGIALGRLKTGTWRYLTDGEVTRLKLEIASGGA